MGACTVDGMTSVSPFMMLSDGMVCQCLWNCVSVCGSVPSFHRTEECFSKMENTSTRPDFPLKFTLKGNCVESYKRMYCKASVMQ